MCSLDVFVCLVDLERHMSNFLEINCLECCQESFNIDGHLLMVIKSLYCRSEVSVCVNSKQSKPFHWSPERMCFVTSHFFNLNELSKQAQLNQ